MQQFINIEQNLDNWRVHKSSRGDSRSIFCEHSVYDTIISFENLIVAWREFRRGKRGKVEIMKFEANLESQVYALHSDLVSGAYQHSPYKRFKISDPKTRLISKACVRDRLLHHAMYRVLYPLFDRTFIYDSYSCRKGKGTHAGFTRLVKNARCVSNNYTKPCFALKCDIKRFFDSVDHAILMRLLRTKVTDQRLLVLLGIVIQSFNAGEAGKGLPLGNVTSQLFANIYLDPLDKFVKHTIKKRYYLRYADDIIILSDDARDFKRILNHIDLFLINRLKLSLHPRKIKIRKLTWGIDFVGYNALPGFMLPRTKTLRRIYKKINYKSLPSYMGYLSHVNGYSQSQKLDLLCIR